MHPNKITSGDLYQLAKDLQYIDNNRNIDIFQLLADYLNETLCTSDQIAFIEFCEMIESYSDKIFQETLK